MEKDAVDQTATEKNKARERIGDPTYLPTFQEIAGAFPGNRFSDTDIFRDYCFEYHIYEFFNKEFINTLGDYLQRRIAEIGQEDKPVTILEVGAGKGQLTHWLKKYLAEHGLDEKRVKFVATDDQSWKGTEKPPFPVEKFDYASAITKYTPDIVLTSWMPLDEDWTPVFRNEPAVKEYILMGETDNGCCGSSETWKTCPYEEDLELPETDRSSGFYRVDLKRGLFRKTGVSSQIGRTDKLPFDPESSFSETVSFRRIGA